MRKLPWILLVLAVLLTACGKPVPPGKTASVGEWRSAAMVVLITPDGSGACKRLEGGVSKSSSGPLQGFAGDDFIVGVGLIKTTFGVSMPPHQDRGAWKMTVDDVELTRDS
jgi:hypothetical protein